MYDDAPSIKEKVLFWEEQDKINQVMIPRVLEMHDTLTSSALLTQKNATLFVRLDASVNQVDKRLSELSGETNQRFLDQSIILKDIEEENASKAEALAGQISKQTEMFDRQLNLQGDALSLIKSETTEAIENSQQNLNKIVSTLEERSAGVILSVEKFEGKSKLEFESFRSQVLAELEALRATINQLDSSSTTRNVPFILSGETPAITPAPVMLSKQKRIGATQNWVAWTALIVAIISMFI